MRFAPYFATATGLAIAATVIVAVITGRMLTILLGFGLIPVAWAIALSVYDVRSGVPALRSVMRSLPLLALGLVLCGFYVLFALGGVGE